MGGHDDTDDIETGNMRKLESAHQGCGALKEVQPVQSRGQRADDNLARARCWVVDVFERTHLGTAMTTLHVCLHGLSCPCSTAIPRDVLTRRTS